MASPATGKALAALFNQVASFGFVPVAIRLHLFQALVGLDRPATGEEVLAALTGDVPDPMPSLLLVQDTLYAMTGLGLVEYAGDNLFAPNDLTRHLVASPSSLHGAAHFTTDALFAAAFISRKLEADNFQYPFQECDTPMQHAYRMTGNDALAREHTYGIIAAEGRMDSFNQFMVGKFFKAGTAPERLKSLGYDLDAVFQSHGTSSSSSSTISPSKTVVDIAGGRGELLLELQQSYPGFTYIVEEFNDAIGPIPGIELVTWDFKQANSPQPIQGALVYNLSHILHNLPDLGAVALLQKLAAAMAPHSRLLIHEFSKNRTYANMHATMLALFGGRERSSSEWHQMADLVGLRVSFEAYPAFGEGLVEMRKM